MTRKSFARACLSAHRSKLTHAEEQTLEKVIAGANLSTETSAEVVDPKGYKRMCWEFTEEARFRALQNQYLGELSRTLV